MCSSTRIAGENSLHFSGHGDAQNTEHLAISPHHDPAIPSLPHYGLSLLTKRGDCARRREFRFSGYRARDRTLVKRNFKKRSDLVSSAMCPASGISRNAFRGAVISSK